MISREPRQKLLKIVQAMKVYVDRRKTVDRHKMPIDDARRRRREMRVHYLPEVATEASKSRHLRRIKETRRSPQYVASN